MSGPYFPNPHRITEDERGVTYHFATLYIDTPHGPQPVQYTDRAVPRSVTHNGTTYHATGKVGRDRATGVVTMEYADGTGRRLWAAAGVVVEVDA